jgi:hypothetical protein
MDERIVEIGKQQFPQEFIERNFVFISMVYMWFTQRARENNIDDLTMMAEIMRCMASYCTPILEGSEPEQDWFTAMVTNPEGHA